jgi:integral membrane sensor domain MASE1
MSTSQSQAHTGGMAPTRVALVAVVLGGTYALGANLPFWFLTTPESGAAFFPPAGLTFAALALMPRRSWPVLLGAVAVAELSVDLAHGQSLAMAIGFALANTFEPLVGASLLSVASRRWARARRLLVAYLAIVAIAPLVGAAFGATTAWLFGDATDWFETFGRWWVGDALGILAVATPILTLARPAQFEPRMPPLELVTVVALATGIIVVPAVLWHRPVLYVVFPLLIWAALRGGARAVSVVGCFVAFAAAWCAATGRAAELLVGTSYDSHLVYMQTFLAVTLPVALILAVEVSERRRAERHALTEAMARAAAELEAMGAVSTERKRIVHETHDIVSHALTAMLLQAGAARRVNEVDRRKTRDLLASIEATGRDAFRDLDVALGLVDHRDPEPSPGLAGFGDLIENMRRAGLDVDFEVKGVRPDVPRLVDWSAYRVVQEAMTNVAKHAPQSHAFVSITYDPSGITIQVTNDLVRNGTRRRNGAHRGLVGLRERVSVLGGEFDAGQTGDEMFVMRARLPVQGNGA